MAHTYTSITKSDNIFISVSDITPIIGSIEEKLTWAYIVPDYDTWVELLAKEHWADWYFATAFVDAWVSLTTPSATYTSKTRADRTYTPVTTPSQTYNEITK